jgi:hypothetical protein
MCLDLQAPFHITTPSDLSRAIRVIKANLKDGTLIESSYHPDEQLTPVVVPFDEVEEKGPWDDYVEHYFSCTLCGRLFKLSAETYHGSGGTWSPIEP